MHGEHGAEDLLVEEAVAGRGGLVDGRLDVEADAVVVGAAGDELERGVGVAGVDDGFDLVEGRAVDDRAHERLQVLVGAADGDFADAGLEQREELLRARLGHVHARGGGALLALVLEGAADGVVDGGRDVGAAVEQVEVLAAGLADDAGELAVGLLADALADAGVDGAEDVGRADEVEAGEVLVREHDVGDLVGVAGDELDDVRRQARLEQDLVDDGAGVDVVLGRLPQDDVAHQRRARDQAATQRGEVERRDGVDETLERPVLHAAPHAVGTAGRLPLQQLGCVVAVEAEEVGQFGRGVDLALPDVLALAQHRRRDELVAVLGGHQLCCPLEDGRSVNERGLLPALLRLQSGLDGGGDLLLGRQRVVGEGCAVLGGHDLIQRLGYLLSFAIVVDFALDWQLRSQLGQFLLQLQALGGASQVGRLSLNLRQLVVVFQFGRERLTLGSLRGSGNRKGAVAFVRCCIRSPVGMARAFLSAGCEGRAKLEASFQDTAIVIVALGQLMIKRWAVKASVAHVLSDSSSCPAMHCGEEIVGKALMSPVPGALPTQTVIMWPHDTPRTAAPHSLSQKGSLGL